MNAALRPEGILKYSTDPAGSGMLLVVAVGLLPTVIADCVSHHTRIMPVFGPNAAD
jgi:hypothetical protein